MEFSFTPDQLALRKIAQDFVAKEIAPYALEMDKAGKLREGLLEKLDEAGMLSLAVPEEFDGPGLDAISIALMYEESRP